jgi:hypothetical protein
MSKNRTTVTNYVILPSALAVTVSLILIITAILTHNVIAQQQQTSASTIKLQAGGGNSTLPDN